MKKRVGSLFVAVLAWTLLFAAASAQAVGQDHVMKIGKKGETTFSQETIVGNITLKPGDYVFRHKVVGADHFISFTKVSEADSYGVNGGGIPEGHPGMIKCRIEPLNKKVSETTVYIDTSGGVQRISKIEVAGENVAHLF